MDREGGIGRGREGGTRRGGGLGRGTKGEQGGIGRGKTNIVWYVCMCESERRENF